MFTLLNHLQYFFQRPWRTFAKTPNAFWRFGRKYLWPFYYTYIICIYFLLSPLRALNAVYYNIWIYGLWSARDNHWDIFFPRTGIYFRKKGFSFFIIWLFGLPIRIIKYSIKSILQIIEGTLYVIHDIIFPTLTMYHGTKKNHSVSISKPGKWRVGSGNFAGSGIYFAIKKSTAKHYAGNHNESVIIYARVTLGKNINLASAPVEIVRCIGLMGSSGEQLTNWGMKNSYDSFEWWRKDEGWWEYCILSKTNSEFVRSRKIRVLFIKNVTTRNIERIWGGKAHWIFNF